MKDRQLIKAIVANEDASFFHLIHAYASVLDMLGWDESDDLDLRVYDTTEFISTIQEQDDLLDIPLELRSYRYEGDIVHFVGHAECWVDTRCYPFEFASGKLTLKQWCRAKGITEPEIISLKAARFANADDAMLVYMTKAIVSPR